MDKIKVAILFGGQSTEHDVSCLSAYSVMKNIDRERFEVNAIGITKQGDWCVIGDDAEKIKTGQWIFDVKKGSGMTGSIGDVYAADVVFPVMHGIMAEDGTMQGLLELIGKPYVGPGVMASAVCMDKAYTKIVLNDAGIPQAKCIIAEREEILKDNGFYEKEVGEKLGYPCFVKPSNSGSSVGAFKVSSEVELQRVLAEAQRYDRKVLIEEYVNAREIECAVLGNESPVAATPGEIIPSKEFYDYEDKYIKGSSVTQIPARITDEQLALIKELAVKAFKAVDCAGLSRVDFFLDKDNGRILLNEINTLPGFTDISMYAKMWAYEGVDFTALVTKLIELAFDNAERNKKASV